MVGGVGIGLAIAVSRSPGEPDSPSATADVDPTSRIESRSVMSELAPDKPLRLAISGNFEGLAPGTDNKLFFAKLGVYTGVITKAAIEALIARARGDVLEHRLVASAKEQLCSVLRDFDETLRDVSLLIDEEETRIKQQLRTQPDRQIRLTRPRERDPRHLELLATRAQLAAAKSGTLWGLNDGPDEVHLIVRWDEWPALAAMNEDRFNMLAERAKRVRRWVDNEYRARGLSLFEQAANAVPATVRSPVGGRKDTGSARVR